MAKKSKGTVRRRYPDVYRNVFLEISARDLDPDKITKALDIQPDAAFRRGVLTDQEGEVVKDKSGKPKMLPDGAWFLNAHVRGNSGLQKRIENILDQIRAKRTILRRILKGADANLTIVVEPNKDLCTATYFLPTALISEFTSLGINLEFRFDNPQIWDEFRQKAAKKQRSDNGKLLRNSGSRVKPRAK